MKEFEKWFLKGGANINKHKAAEQNAWRAALKMVCDYMIEQESNAPYFDYVLLDKIEKELEDEN